MMIHFVLSLKALYLNDHKQYKLIMNRTLHIYNKILNSFCQTAKPFYHLTLGLG